MPSMENVPSPCLLSVSSAQFIAFIVLFICVTFLSDPVIEAALRQAHLTTKPHFGYIWFHV
jgi:hypothetical protein